VLSTLSETICTNDIAFVVLDREVDLPVLPLRLDGRAERGEAVTLVGYGLDETMDPRDPFELRLQERTRRSGLTIAAVGPETVDEVTTTPPRMIVLDGPSGCLGDSGGPLIDSETHALLGIYSLLDGETCLGPNLRHLFGHLPSFRALIDQAFAAADAEPVLERVPSVGGAGGESGSAGEAGAAGAAAGDSGSAGAPDVSAGAGGERAIPRSEGGEGGAEDPTAGGTAGTPRPAPPAVEGASGGCSVSSAQHPPFAAGFIAFVMAAYAVRRRRFSAGCRADLLRAHPPQ
jgi:MYXO-CTERM domain-containing protein